MKSAGTLKLTTPGERELVMTRSFDAPRNLVFDAHTKPDLVKRWLLGPPGWSMPVCEIDPSGRGKVRSAARPEKRGSQMGDRGGDGRISGARPRLTPGRPNHLRPWHDR